MDRPRVSQEQFSEIAAIRWLHAHRRGFVAFVYLWFVVYSTLLPFDFHWANGHRGFVGLGHTFHADPAYGGRSDAVLNVLLYIPAGAAVCLAVQHRFRRWSVGVLLGFLISTALAVAIEFVQLFSSSRVGSTTDMITNASGALIGCAVAPAIAVVLKNLRRRRREALATQPLWQLAVWAAVGLVVCGLVPFDVRGDLGQLKEGFQAAHVRPFWQLADATDSGSADRPEAAEFWVDFAGNAGAFLMFGALMAMAATAEARLGVIASVFATLWVGVGLAAGIEAAQILIASRGFDTTDIVGAAAGSAAGAVLGAAAGWLAARRRWRWDGPQRLIGTPVLVLVLLGQAGYLVALGLEPFRFSRFPGGESLWRAVGLVPFQAYTENLTPALVAEFVLKLLRYALLGVFLTVLAMRVPPGGTRPFVRRIAVVAVAAMGLSAVIEVAQLSIPGRYCDVTDVVIAGMGAVAATTGVQWYLDAVRYARVRLRRSAGASPVASVVCDARSA